MRPIAAASESIALPHHYHTIGQQLWHAQRLSRNGSRLSRCEAKAAIRGFGGGTKPAALLVLATDVVLPLAEFYRGVLLFVGGTPREIRAC